MQASQIGTHYARRATRTTTRRPRQFTIAAAPRTSVVKHIAVVVALVAVLVAVAVGVGSAVFFGSASSRLSLGSDEVRAALTSPQAGEAYYALFAADLNASDDDAGFSADAVVLARIDAASQALTLVSVPSNMQVSMNDGKAHALSDAVSVGGDAELVSCVSTFADVPIAHYARTDANGIEAIAERLGGVEVAIAEEVDDPSAGTDYIPSGNQTLSGQQALTFLRAKNFDDGVAAQGKNQCAFLAAVAERLLAADGPALLGMLDSVAGSVRCDLDANAAVSLVSPLSGLSADSVYVGCVPGYESTDNGVTSFIASSNSWTEMMETVDSGGDPSAEDPAVAAVDPNSFTITVRNGSGITGGATQLADTLGALGFDVAETGNADSYVYTETLVVYDDDDMQAKAESVVAALGYGRAIASNGFYEFDTDVLVMLGSDFAPAS